MVVDRLRFMECKGWGGACISCIKKEHAKSYGAAFVSLLDYVHWQR